MFNRLFSMVYLVNDRNIHVIIVPNFKNSICELEDTMEVITSSGMYPSTDCQGDSEFIDVPESTTWVITTKDIHTCIYITEYTKEITVDIGNGMNSIFNQLINETTKAYYNKKKREIRLYFWSSRKETLKLCKQHPDLSSVNSDSPLAYYLPTTSSAGQAIHKRFAKPDQDCFILGRVRRTLITRDSRQTFDFIEPISKVNLDFVKNGQNSVNFRKNIDLLATALLDLLFFCIINTNASTESLKYKRILAYIRTAYDADAVDIKLYIKEVKVAFKEGNLVKLRNLSKILNTPQDCSNVKFELCCKQEITCNPTSTLLVRFSNGETVYKTAEWIYQNRAMCTNSIILYLRLHNQYTISMMS
ncbi:MAG: hypothetical protein HFJ47_00275 [Clostridia bacterium]|nr:hypothetical protein [Clostridia bacterium]